MSFKEVLQHQIHEAINKSRDHGSQVNSHKSVGPHSNKSEDHKVKGLPGKTELMSQTQKAASKA